MPNGYDFLRMTINSLKGLESQDERWQLLHELAGANSATLNTTKIAKQMLK
jgi:hypothetical protein